MPENAVISSEIVEKVLLNYSIFDHILIFFITRLFGARRLYFYPAFFLVTFEPHTILLKPL